MDYNICMSDRKKYDKKYYALHKERLKEKAYEWKKKNPEKVKAIKRKYVKNHPEQVKKWQQNYLNSEYGRNASLKRQRNYDNRKSI